ncbi:MAG: metallophosphoesterase [Bacilli bacterium]
MLDIKNYKLNTNYKKKIALISDIHFSSNYKKLILDKIIKNLIQNNPDYICIPGDIIDQTLELNDINKKYLLEFFKTLGQIGIVIISLGNHDVSNYQKGNYQNKYDKEWFMKLNTIENVHFLDNNSFISEEFCFLGLTLSFDYYYKSPHEDINSFINSINDDIYPNLRTNKFNIMLCHSPYVVLEDIVLEKVKIISKMDLILSGHMHNGVMLPLMNRLKGSRGLVGPFMKLLPKNARGMVIKKLNDKEIKLIISGGIITFSNIAPSFYKLFNGLFLSSIEYIDL